MNSEDTDITEPHSLLEWRELVSKTHDINRPGVIEKRYAKGFRTARENLEDLVDLDSFVEYGQFTIAAQRGRRDIEELRQSTAADGVITGLATINSNQFGRDSTSCAVAINDYSVIAGTQGYFHHLKLDRLIQVARKQKLAMVMFTEGGGGRPGDTDSALLGGVSLPDTSFMDWAKLCREVPTIAVNNGYCFAGSAALFGCANIRIATRKSWIGMAGPAMIEGGGLGFVKPEEIGPVDLQSKTGVVDIVANDEAHATALVKEILALTQGDTEDWCCHDQTALRTILPENRRLSYDSRELIDILVDTSTFLELGRNFGCAMVTGFARIEGIAMGLLANDCRVMAGAIDCDAAKKASRFFRLCNHLRLPVVTLCDTPGFMVGLDSEAQGAAYYMPQMFIAAAELEVPLVTIFTRRAYGLGAQAMSGGSFDEPITAVSWPSGEFGAMGLEGAVKLGFKRELEEVPDGPERQELFDTLLEKMYVQGKANEVGSSTVFDAVIDPADSRRVIKCALAL